MRFLPGNVYHVYNQGNNNQVVFEEEVHFNYFLQLYQRFLVPNCETLAWCLMHTHFHFMIYTDERVLELKHQGALFLDPVTNGFRKLLSGYAHEYNRKNNRSGSLFRPKTKSICLNESTEWGRDMRSGQGYYLTLLNYIHDNPVRAGLVYRAEEWKWSSCRFYRDLQVNSICNKELARQICGL